MALLNNAYLINGAQVPDTSGIVSDFQNTQANQMKINAAQQQAAQDADLKKLRIQSGGDLGQFIKLAGAAGYDTTDAQKALDASNQSQATTAKTLLDSSNTKLTALNNGIASVVSNPTTDNLKFNLLKLHSAGLINDDQYNQTLQSAPTDPAGIKVWAQSAALGNMKDGGQLAATNPKPEIVNTGGQQQLYSRDPLTGKVINNGTFTNTQSPDNAATQFTTQRGQDITAATQRRGQDINAATAAAKNASDKPINDAQAKALGYGTRMTNANNTLEALYGNGDGTSRPNQVQAALGKIPLIGGGIANAYAASIPTWMGGTTADQQRVDQAQRDFVNAVLRRESGAAISESEFDNARKQYFPQVGDSPDVIAQKKLNREITTRAVLAEAGPFANQVDGIISGNQSPPAQQTYKGKPANPDAQLVQSPFIQPQTSQNNGSSFTVQQNGRQTVINGRSYSGAQIEAYAKKNNMTVDQVINLINTHK